MCLLKSSVASEAIAAQDRPVGTRLERNLTVFPALGANCVVHLARRSIAGTASGVALASDTAGFATLRLVREALFGEKFLLVGSKGEFLSAIFADDSFVAVHQIPQIKYCMARKYTTQMPLYRIFPVMSIK